MNVLLEATQQVTTNVHSVLLAIIKTNLVKAHVWHAMQLFTMDTEQILA